MRKVIYNKNEENTTYSRGLQNSNSLSHAFVNTIRRKNNDGSFKSSVCGVIFKM